MEKSVMFRITALVEEPEEAKILPGIIKEKMEFLNQTNLKNNEREVLNDILNQNKDLSFLLEQDFEEYGDELDKVLKDQDPIMVQYHRNTGVCTLNGGGQNDYLQAVFQCFIRLEPLAEFFMTRVYRNIKATTKPKRLCDLIGNVLCEANCDEQELIKKLDIDVNLYELQEYMSNTFEDPAGSVDAGEFVTALFKSVKKELGI